MKLVLQAPLFKGIIDTPKPEALMMITRKNPGKMTHMDQGAYLELLQHEQRKAVEAPEALQYATLALLQNIARVASTALLAARTKQQGGEARLIAVEGCRHRIGGRSMSGAEVANHIWEDVVPVVISDHCLRPIVHCISDCTMGEVRALFQYAPRDSTLQPVTHAYHRDRVDLLFAEERNGHDVHGTQTPEEIAQGFDVHPQTQEGFLKQIIAIASPPPAFVAREEKAERSIYKPLHTLSHSVERWTRGRFNLELFLARKMRKDQQ